jgi:hypothetical protein
MENCCKGGAMSCCKKKTRRGKNAHACCKGKKGPASCCCKGDSCPMPNKKPSTANTHRFPSNWQMGGRFLRWRRPQPPHG